MAAFRIVAFLGLVAVSSSVTLQSCDQSSGKGSISLEWETCLNSSYGYAYLVLDGGTLAAGTAVATFRTYSDNDTICMDTLDTINVNCSCNHPDATMKLQCGSAATMIPSTILIIAAIMAYL
eukprot:TRINITY_DN47079_c0_g1_i1.p1 TRINITY_DN47079_c0_g1~~TRINITY_DN47079_c0_g1_i1.p1  ORF type:complete len:122 (+),score=12.48 TRINITY_DN47079_c0_g1_i1:46-411(+)